MTREETMSLIAQLAYLNIPIDEDGHQIDITNMQDLAQYYITNPDKLYQQNNGTEIPCLMSTEEWKETLSCIANSKEFEDYEIAKYEDQGKTSGFNAYCFVNRKEKNVIFAFRGSEHPISDFNDWEDNKDGMFKVGSTQQDLAFNLQKSK